jgi:hypothetical protein
MLPAPISSLTSLGYGLLSVSFTHLRPKELLVNLPAANHRFFIHFGEEHCRLSSDQSILEVPDNKWSLVLAIVSNTLLFGLPKRNQAKFESLWVDQLAYISPRRNHFRRTIEELSHMMLSVSSFPLAIVSSLNFDPSPSPFSCEKYIPLPGNGQLIFCNLRANVLMIQVSSIPGLIYSSLLLCVAGLIMTSVLLREQRGLVDTDAVTAVSMTLFYTVSIFTLTFEI